jgi:hypothetical protein
MRRMLSVSLAAGFILIAAGCNSGPQPPQPGTPAFLWSAAKTTYAAGDFLKASDDLSQLVKSASEFTAPSEPWSMVVSAGIAQAYMDLADNFEEGARANRANPTPFRRQVTVFRSQAGAVVLQYAETVHKFLDENKSESIALEFGYPTGNAAQPVQLERVAKGMVVPDADLESLEAAMTQRGVLRSALRAVGAADDPAKGLAVFKTGDVKAPRPVFLAATARALVEQTDLFTPKELDQPARATMLCDEAEAALKSIPESKETKELLGRIAKIRKAAKTL